jgi:hypothetical protein
VEYLPYGLELVNILIDFLVRNFGNLPSSVVDEERPLFGLCQAI